MIFAVAHGNSPIRQGRHFHTSPLAAPTAPQEQQRGVVRNGDCFLLLVVLLLQYVCDELGGLFNGQRLTYQDVEELFVDLHIVLLLEVKIT